MDIINYILYEVSVFFILLYTYIFLFMIFYIITKCFIKRNISILCKFLGVDSNYIKSMKIEDIFIMTGNFARLYFFYLLEIKVLKRERIRFLFKNDLDLYVYPNLDNYNAIKLLEKYYIWFFLNFIFVLVPFLIFCILLVIDIFFSDIFNFIVFNPILRVY